MIDDIVNSAMGAALALERLKSIPPPLLDLEAVGSALREAVNLKLMISEQKETDLRKLVIMSIKEQDLRGSHLPDHVIQQRIRQYDCHQTSLAAQKKVLLIMFIEKKLKIHLDDEEATEVQNLDELAQAVLRHMKEGG